MELKFADLINVNLLQEMAERLYKLAGIPVGIIDLEGVIHVKAGWQAICTEFHRKNPDTAARCFESDRYIEEHLFEGDFVEYKCLNNLWDIALPIMIGGKHMATLFVGQFFYTDEIVDVSFFEEQAGRYGFDRELYMEALEKVPRFSRAQVLDILDYYKMYIAVLAESGLSNWQNKMDKASIQQYADIVSSMQSGLFVYQLQDEMNDSSLVLLNANEAAISLLGLNRGDIIGKAINELFPNLHKQGVVSKFADVARRKYLLGREEIHYQDEQIKEAWFSFKVFPIPDNCICVLFEDISEQKKAEQDVIFLSYHDHLTGLFNRRFFEAELERLDVERNYPLTLIMADVNGLKLINDSFGHQVGDEILIAVAEVLKNGCRSDEIIARLGGDEFVIILPRTNSEHGDMVVERILSMAKDKQVGPVHLSISFGFETKTSADEAIEEVLKRAEDSMYKKKIYEGPSMRSKTISAIMSTLYEKNRLEKLHSDRVSELCVRIGTAIRMTESDVGELRMIGLLHDIGKIAIDDDLLNRVGKLTDDEFDEIKKHPEIGARILSSVSEMADLSTYILYHHERWDGQGYPRGLKGESIPLQSRIIAIVDAYDAITSERSYRKALDEDEAVKELLKHVGTQFDPKLIKIFITKVLKVEIPENEEG